MGIQPYEGPGLARFLETYREERRRLHVEHPELYSDAPLTIRGNDGSVTTFPAARSEEGIERFCDAIRKGTFGLPGEALKATCRRLRIKHTYKAIRAFVECKPPDDAVHYAVPGWGAECGRALCTTDPDRKRTTCPACLCLLADADAAAKAP